MMGGLAMDYTKDERNELFRELDKGIDDMEAGRLTPHDETMRELKQHIKEYVLQNPRIRRT